MDSVQNRGLGVCAPQLLRFILLVWHFTCRFDFRHKSKIAICGLPVVAAFAVLWAKGGEGLVVVPVGTMGSFLPRDSLFRAVEGSGGLWTLSKIESLARARVSPSEVYPAGKLSDTGKSKIAICGRFCSPEGVKKIFILLLKF